MQGEKCGLCGDGIFTSRCLSVNDSLVFLRSIAWIGSSQNSVLQFFALVFGCHVLPKEVYSSHPPCTQLSCPPPPAPKPRPLNAHFASFTHHSHCKSSHLFPFISVLYAFCKPLLHLPIRTPSAQQSVAMVVDSSSTSKIIHLHDQETRQILSCLLLPPPADST